MNEKEKPKISVIIPVYNTEKYLKECIDSVINQTLKDIEIILINDGSTDNSGKICEEYAEKDTRIRVIHQKNSGVSVARNKGLDAADGEFLSFIDSDDKIDFDFYEKLYKKAIETNSDIVKANVKTIDYNGNILESVLNPKIIEKQNKWYFNYEWWSAIYKAEMIKKNKIRFFDNYISGQDILFLHNALENVKILEVINDTYYYWKRRENSLYSRILSYEKVISLLNIRKKILIDTNKIYSREKINKETYIYLYQHNFRNSMRYFFRNNIIKSKIKCILYLFDFYNICLEKHSINNYYIERIANNLKRKTIYFIYTILVKLGIKDSVKKILQKCGYKFDE